MRKIVYTLNVDGYQPEISALTRPLIKRWTKKIGAEYREITDRCHLGFPVVFEKFQIWQLAQRFQADWHIYVDLDCAIHPNFIDFTEYLHKDTVTCFKTEPATYKYKSDHFFRRDGRFIGVGSFLIACSDWCLDLWHPTDLTYAEILERVTATTEELENGIDSSHLGEEFVVSRNIAKYGLKFKPVIQIQQEIGIPMANHCWHAYRVAEEVKLQKLQDLIAAWRV